MKIYAKNRKAKYEFEFLDKFEAGIALLGTEVKAIKEGNVDLTGSYVVIDNDGNAQWLNGNISRYQFQTQGSHDERRTRQLLLKKKELRKLKEEIQLRRLTIVPYMLYANHRGHIKLEIHVARGKNVRDKRESIKARDLKRQNESERY